MELHEFKEYMDEKFAMNNETLNEKFLNVNQTLSTIKEQTFKTNGRVNKLEDKMQSVESINALHLSTCTVKKDFEAYKDKMEEDLFLITFMRKYPKISWSIGIMVISLIATGGVAKAITLVSSLLGLN